MSPSVEPFSEVKYKALMDGLECSELLLSNLERTARIDSEFYKKENLSIEHKLRETIFHPITDFFWVSDGNHMSISDNFCLEGIPYYRGQDIYHVFIEESSPICIDDATYNHPHMRRSQLQQGDVLMSIVGAIIGNSAIVYTNNKATCSCKLAILRSKGKGVIPEVLLAYIKSVYGQNQIQKFKRGAAQTGLLLEDFDQLLMPVFGDAFQGKIKEIIIKSHNMITNASQLYNQAEQMLMNLIDYQPATQQTLSVSIKSCGESFCATSRLDAEYYQPKYDEYWKTLHEFDITSIPNEYDVFKNSGTDYAEEIEDVGVVKTKQLGNSGIDIDGVDSYFTIQKCTENRSTYLKKNDVVFASMGVGSLGKISLFTHNGDKKYVTDSTLRIYRAKPACRVLPEVLCVFLQSWIGQELIYRYVVGSTGIINIYDDDMAKIPIPVLDDTVQKEIATKVQAYFALRQQSKQLLEYAEQAVEMAIEQGEDAALKWLNDKLPEKVE